MPVLKFASTIKIIPKVLTVREDEVSIIIHQADIYIGQKITGRGGQKPLGPFRCGPLLKIGPQEQNISRNILTKIQPKKIGVIFGGGLVFDLHQNSTKKHLILGENLFSKLHLNFHCRVGPLEACPPSPAQTSASENPVLETATVTALFL